jgi:hypothetical protein
MGTKTPIDDLGASMMMVSISVLSFISMPLVNIFEYLAT